MPATTNNSIAIYVINLDRSVQRLIDILKQLDAQHLIFTRIPAVDGREASKEQRALLDEAGYRKLHGKKSLPGELGCYLSHVQVMKAFIQSSDAFAVILEDDVILEPFFGSTIQQLAATPHTWDMVKLSGVHSGTPVSVQTVGEHHHLCVMFSRCTGSSAYMLNRAAAESYLASLIPMTLPYDHEFDKGWKYGIKVRSIRPFCVVHNHDSPTTITSANGRNFPRWQRLATYRYRLGNELRRIAYAASQYLARPTPK